MTETFIGDEPSGCIVENGKVPFESYDNDVQ